MRKGVLEGRGRERGEPGHEPGPEADAAAGSGGVAEKVFVVELAERWSVGEAAVGVCHWRGDEVIECQRVSVGGGVS